MCSLVCWFSHLTPWFCWCTYMSRSQNSSLHLFHTVYWWLMLECMFLFSGLLCINISNVPTRVCALTLHTRSYLWCITCLLAITKLWCSGSMFLLAHRLVAHQQLHVCTHKGPLQQHVLFFSECMYDSTLRAKPSVASAPGTHVITLFRDSSASVFKKNFRSL